MTLIDSRQAGEILGVTHFRVYQLVSAGQLTAQRLSGRYVFEEGDVRELAERRAEASLVNGRIKVPS
jgi:predicted site-specific integrase-resolvase